MQHESNYQAACQLLKVLVSGEMKDFAEVCAQHPTLLNELDVPEETARNKMTALSFISLANSKELPAEIPFSEIAQRCECDESSVPDVVLPVLRNGGASGVIDCSRCCVALVSAVRRGVCRDDWRRVRAELAALAPALASVEEQTKTLPHFSKPRSQQQQQQQQQPQQQAQQSLLSDPQAQ
eukprot:TRINITY_DN2811_c0_g1_i1.p1 TRINITY_DN2811_c0_g1~~TRINITY_DN2811_c0_g1_i1.p1  ORF type:complete len:181 (+),score=62.10 TRINITY_DN2811_c0_g1_i1:534-1076(+)